MSATRKPSRPVSGPPAYAPTTVPVYRGGGAAAGGGAAISDFLVSADTGGYWNYQDETTVLNASGVPITPGATGSTDWVREVTEHSGIPSTTDSITQAFDSVRYTSDKYGFRTSGGTTVGLVWPSGVSTATGFVAMSVHKWTGFPNNLSGVSCMFLNDHKAPRVSFWASGGGPRLEFLIDEDTGNTRLNYDAAGLNDGTPFTVGLAWDPDSGIAKYLVNGSVVGTATPSNTGGKLDNLDTGLNGEWNYFSMSTGSRSGSGGPIENEHTRGLCRNRGPASDAELLSLHEFLMDGL